MDNKKYDRTKHLEMIQSNISRISSKSTSIRGWAITLISAILIFGDSSKDMKIYFYLIVALPLISFYILDTYYNQIERKFRELYEDVRKGNKKDYELIPSKVTIPDISKGLTSFSQLIFYLPVVVLLVLISIFLAKGI